MVYWWFFFTIGSVIHDETCHCQGYFNPIEVCSRMIWSGTDSFMGKKPNFVDSHVFITAWFFFGFRLLLTKFKGTNYMRSIMVFTTQESVMPRPTNREFFTVQSCHPCKTRCVTCPFGAADKMFRVGKGGKDRKITQIPRLNKETKTTVWSQGNSFTSKNN